MILFLKAIDDYIEKKIINRPIDKKFSDLKFSNT